MTDTEHPPAHPPLSDFFEDGDGAHRAPADADTDPDFDDVDEFGAAPAKQRRVPVLTGLLALGVVLALTFTAGVLVQKRHDAGITTASTGAAAANGGFPGGALGAPPGAASSAGSTASGGSTATSSGPVVIGTVVSIKGETMTVKDLGGKKHVVHLTATTKAEKTTTIAADTLKPGTTVSVDGTSNSDGSVAATTITTR